MAPYPKFVPPEALSAREHRDWSAQEAKAYLAWLTSVVEPRTRGLLVYFGEADAGDPGELLDRLGRKAAHALRDSRFSVQEGPRPKLTDEGYALAADLGLLVAKLVLERGGGGAHWEVLRKPKSDASYNLPVLAGKGMNAFDPVGASIGQAYGVLRSDRGHEVWRSMYEHALGALRSGEAARAMGG